MHHDQLAETRQLMSLLIDVHTKLFPDDLKIFEVEFMVESSVEKIESYRDQLHGTVMRFEQLYRSGAGSLGGCI